MPCTQRGFFLTHNTRGQFMSKIIRLAAENYKRIEAVEITPDGSIVTIAGKNGQGKSSVLDAITAALGGVDKRSTPKPIRDGADSAEIVLETEDLVVTRRFTKAGGSTLTVETHDGAKFPKGQAKLNDLLGKLSLDPLAFTQLSDREQRETLIDLVDLPFNPAELDQRRAELYEQRTEVGRQEKAIGAVEVDESLPTAEHSATELIDRIHDAEDRNRRIAEAQDNCRHLEDRIAELEQQLQAAKRDLKAATKIAAEEYIDTNDLKDQLQRIEVTNAEIRANNDARQRHAQRSHLKEEYAKLSAQIEQIDEQKAQGLAQAELPVEGLGFDDHGVTFDGIPFKQTNTASQIRVSLAMAMAMNPKLRVIRIKEGSLLDEDNLQIIADLAEQHDYQIWIETVGTGDGTGIVIEDGGIKQ